MALGSYNLSHHRQAYHFYVTPAKRRISLNSTWWQSWIICLGAGIKPDGVDFASAVGDIGLNNPVTAITMDGVDFQSAVGEDGFGIGIRRCSLGHDVDSYFQSQNESTNPQDITVDFLFNQQEYSNRVTRYPNITRNYKDVVGKDWNITLENASKTMNQILSERTLFKNAAGEVRFGYMQTANSFNNVCMGGGVLIRATYENNKVIASFRNRMNILSQVNLSTDTQSKGGVYFDDAEYNPADLVWTALTANSFGAKFSSIESYTNPQIHYDSWKTWKDTLTGESITCMGFIPESVNYLKFLQNVAEMTDSAIYVEADNRIYFKRNLTGVDSFSATVSEADIIQIKTTGDAYDMCNRYTMPLSLKVTDNKVDYEAPNAFVTFANSASVNSYGGVTKKPTNNYLWYTNSATAKNLADRILFRRKEPETAITITTPMKYQQQQLGDIIYIYSDEIDFQDQAYTLIGTNVDLNTLQMQLELSAGHGIAIANVTVFELNDPDLGTLDGTIGVLG